MIGDNQLHLWKELSGVKKTLSLISHGCCCHLFNSSLINTQMNFSLLFIFLKVSHIKDQIKWLHFDPASVIPAHNQHRCTSPVLWCPSSNYWHGPAILRVTEVKHLIRFIAQQRADQSYLAEFQRNGKYRSLTCRGLWDNVFLISCPESFLVSAE